MLHGPTRFEILISIVDSGRIGHGEDCLGAKPVKEDQHVAAECLTKNEALKSADDSKGQRNCRDNDKHE